MAAKKTQRGEWVGGLGVMPVYVADGGERHRPEMLFWISEEGILGHAVGKPGTMLAAAAESLRATIERPAVGLPHAPKRLRVASKELAEVLRAAYREIEVVCAPTPELDEFLAAMRERLGEESDVDSSYLAGGAPPESVAAFFRAAAKLFRAKPWAVVPSDGPSMSVTIEDLDLRGAVLAIIGQRGESLGFILFETLDDYEAYLDAVDAMERDEEPVLPRHLALNFERGADVVASARKEISSHHWEVAAADAYPWLVSIEAIDAELVALPPSAREVAIAEAVSLALPALLEETKKETLRDAWSGGAPVERTLPVRAHAGELSVTFRVPCEDVAAAPGLMADFRAIEGEEIDERALAELGEALFARFAESPEAKGLANAGACNFILDFGGSYFRATIATLRARQLREIMFELFPRKVVADASEAPAIIAEARAFYTFLKREFGLKQADACLRVLGGDAEAKLAAALSDSSGFGMAKSLFGAGVLAALGAPGTKTTSKATKTTSKATKATSEATKTKKAPKKAPKKK